MTSKTTDWLPSLSDFQDVEEKVATLILDEAKILLSATVIDSEHLTRNSVYVLGAVVAVLSACAGLLVRSIDLHIAVNQQDWKPIAVFGVIFLYVSGVGIRLIRGAFRFRGIEHCGNNPANLIKPQYLVLNYPLLLLLEAASYKSRIDENTTRNAQTGAAINAAIRGLCFTPAVFVLSVVVTALT